MTAPLQQPPIFLKLRLLKYFVVFGLPAAILALLFALIVLPILGAYRIYRIPTEAMSPTISKSDVIVVNYWAFLFSPPRRGEIVAFRTDDIASIPKTDGHGQVYLKRIAGRPGDQLRIKDDKLEVNDVLDVTLVGENVHRSESLSKH